MSTVGQMKKQHADNLAVVVGAMVQGLVMLGVLGGLSPDEVAQLGGALLIVAGAVRSVWRAVQGGGSWRQILRQHADNAAVLVGALTQSLVLLGVVERLGLTTEQVAQAGGLLIMAAGAFRSLWRARREVQTGATPQDPKAATPKPLPEQDTPTDSG